MPAQVYKDMLDVMLKRGGSFAGADVPEFYAMMEELFTPGEALVNNALPRQPVTAAELANRMGRGETEVGALLESMANKGTCVTFMQGKERVYQGAPFMLGIFEYQFMGGGSSERERRIARLIDEYKKAYHAAKGSPKASFPLTRVITVDRKIEAGNRIHTYDQVATYIDKYDTIGVGACFCRHTAKLRGEDIHGMPTDVCMWFGEKAQYTVERLGSRRVSKQEAREVLDRAEKAGLLHMSRNTSEELEFLCNCDRWHCDVVTQMLKYPRPGLLFNSGFMPRVDCGKCSSCGTCVERCPSGALTLDAGAPECDLDRCFGCAVCATGCPEEAIGMEARPNRPEPPKTMKDLVTAIKSAK